MVGGLQDLDADTKKEATARRRDAGEVRWGHDTTVGYFAQDHHEALGQHVGQGDERRSSGSTSLDTKPPQEEIRAILGRLLFSGRAGAQAGRGAVRRRVRAPAPRPSCSSCKHNVLVLDEPTNHLDIESIEGLLDGLKLLQGHGRRRQPRPPLRRRAGEARRRAPAGARTPRCPTSAGPTRSTWSARGRITCGSREERGGRRGYLARKVT